MTRDEKSDVERGIELLWGKQPPSDSGRRPRLTSSKIILKAIEIADAEGLDAVSMQRIAGELGYTPMSLYRYVPGKALLVDAMSDRAFGSPPAEAPPAKNPPKIAPAKNPSGKKIQADKSWRNEVHHWADALWDLYQQHPWMVEVKNRTAPTGPHELAWFESLMSPLARSGLAHGEMVGLSTFIFSAVRDLARIASELVPMAFSYGEVLHSILHGDGFPTLAAVIKSGTFDQASGGENEGLKAFVTLGLNQLMDGIESQQNPKTNHKE